MDSWSQELSDAIERVARVAPSPAQAVIELVRLCAARRPHADWDALLALNFADDAQRIKAWMAELFTVDPPREDVTHLWFGLGDDGGHLYVVGYPWDPFQDHPLAPVRWDPKRPANSTVLVDIVAIADAGSVDGLGNDATYPLCLTYAAVSLRLTLQALGSVMQSSTAHQRIVMVGFDGGDHLELGTLGPAGQLMAERG